MKMHKSLKETTHRRTYNLVSKHLFANCPYCPWHPNFWRLCTRYSYLVYEEDGSEKNEKQKFQRHPNWKLVSKNKKQWMKKPYIQVRRDYPDGNFYITFRW
jgi:hypothetical protein